MKKVAILIIAALLLVLLFLLVTPNNNSYMPQQKETAYNCKFNIWPYISKAVLPAQVAEVFPYKSYADNANTMSVKCILNDIKLLDIITKNHEESCKILSDALTAKLQQQIDGVYSGYQPDSLIYLMQWAERFQYYAEVDDNNDIFFNSIYHYWLNYITTKLAAYSAEKPSLKYDFKFKFLVAKCNEKKYNPGLKVTPVEKVIDNIVQSRWGHLLNAVWNETSWLQKILILLFIALFVYGIACILQKHIFKAAALKQKIL